MVQSVLNIGQSGGLNTLSIGQSEPSVFTPDSWNNGNFIGSEPVSGSGSGLFDNLSGGDVAVAGLSVLSNALAGIASYQAAKKNLRKIRENGAATFAALEQNISTLRYQYDQKAASNRTKIGASGIKSDTFADIMQANKIIEENDISVMRANTREAVYKQIYQAIEDKYAAKNKAVWGTVGSLVGAGVGALTGNPQAAILLSSAGGNIGSAAGGI